MTLKNVTERKLFTNFSEAWMFLRDNELEGIFYEMRRVGENGFECYLDDYFITENNTLIEEGDKVYDFHRRFLTIESVCRECELIESPFKIKYSRKVIGVDESTGVKYDIEPAFCNMRRFSSEEIFSYIFSGGSIVLFALLFYILLK